MRTVGTYEAKTHLPRLLDSVEHGETVVITRYGKPIARIVPYEDAQRAARNAAVEAMIAYRAEAPSLAGISVKDLIAEGRRH